MDFFILQIQAERERQLDELAMLETHIMQARAAATAAEEQEIRRVAEGCSNYEVLGLPPGKYYTPNITVQYVTVPCVKGNGNIFSVLSGKRRKTIIL